MNPRTSLSDEATYIEMSVSTRPHMENPYKAPRVDEVAPKLEKSRPRWLARGFSVLLFGATVITFFSSILVVWTDYFSSEGPGTRITATLTLFSFPLTWGPASYFFWNGTQTKRRWLLVAFPTLVIVATAMVTVLVYGPSRPR